MLNRVLIPSSYSSFHKNFNIMPFGMNKKSCGLISWIVCVVSLERLYIKYTLYIQFNQCKYIIIKNACFIQSQSFLLSVKLTLSEKSKK